MAQSITAESLARSILELRETLRENAREVREQMQETDRRMQETDRRMQETDRRMQETDRRMQETDQEVKKMSQEVKKVTRSIKKLETLFTSQWGKLVEALVEGSLIELLSSQGIAVTHTMTRFSGIYKKKEREFDIIAANGDEVVAVEVKTTLKPKDVDYFLETMRDFRGFCPEYARWKVYGAVAYIKSDAGAQVYAEKKGLFVIRAVGKSALLMNTAHFKPKELALSN